MIGMTIFNVNGSFVVTNLGSYQQPFCGLASFSCFGFVDRSFTVLLRSPLSSTLFPATTAFTVYYLPEPLLNKDISW